MSYIHLQGKDHLPHNWEDLDHDQLLATVVTPQSGDAPETPQAQILDEWDRARLDAYIHMEHRVVVLIDGWVVDITQYMKEHVRLSKSWVQVSPTNEATFVCIARRRLHAQTILLQARFGRQRRT